MFGELLGGLFDKHEATHSTIYNALESIAQERGVSHNEIFIMIKPHDLQEPPQDEDDKQFDFKLYVYQMIDNNPKYIREITLKEILGDG